MSEMKSSLLRAALMAGVALGVTTPVMAQDANKTDNVETVTVKARRPLAESDAAALQEQRKSDSIVSVLSADTIGDLPDQNVAFAIGRLPGVALERDQGQARYVNLRGMPRKWATISFDGVGVVSAEGRDTRLDNIPSAIASRIIVNKALTPNMSGDTVAGNIDVRTRRAFDYKGQKITGKAGYGIVSLGGGEEIDTNFVYSNIFMDGKLGLVAQASYYRRNMATENWETDPYLTNTTDVSKRFAREFEYKNYRLVRHNSSLSLRGDYKIDNDNTVFASLVGMQFRDDELRDNWIVRLDQGTNAAGVSYTNAANISASDPKFGLSYGARLNGRIDYRDSVESLAHITFGGEHKWMGFDVNWRLNYAMADNGGDTPVTAAFQSPSDFLQRPTAQFDFRNPDANIVRLFRTGGTTTARTQGAQVVNAEEFSMPLQNIGRATGGELTTAWTAKVDFARETDLFGRSTKVAFGFLYTDRDKKNEVEIFTATPADLTAAGLTVPTWGSVASDKPYRGKQQLGFTYRYTRDGFLENYVDNLIDKGIAKRVMSESTTNYWSINENLMAGYLMATTDLDFGNVVYGARVEKIENTGRAWSSSQSRFIETSSSDTLVYPSVHLNWDVTSELKARFGLTTSASRPDYDDLRPNFTFSDSGRTVSGGNPKATPEKQVGLDAYLEWYRPSGFVSVGLFYKDIKDVLFRQAGVFGSNILDSNGVNRSDYTLTTLRNGGDGYLRGLEVFVTQTAEDFVVSNGMPDWMGGFGVKASATFVDSEATVPSVDGVPARKVSIPGASDGVYNLQALYEKYGLTVRLAYQYRTTWMQDIGSYQVVNNAIVPSGNGDTYWDNDEEIDLTVRYQVNKNLEWFFDASNIGDQPSRRYVDSKAFTIEYERFGPRYVTGMRFNF